MEFAVKAHWGALWILKLMQCWRYQRTSSDEKREHKSWFQWWGWGWQEVHSTEVSELKVAVGGLRVESLPESGLRSRSQPADPNLREKRQKTSISDARKLQSKARKRGVGVVERGVRRAAMSQRDLYLCAPPVSAVGARGQRTVI